MRNPLKLHLLERGQWRDLIAGRKRTRRIARTIGVKGGERRRAVRAYTEGFLGEARRQRNQRRKRR